VIIKNSKVHSAPNACSRKMQKTQGSYQIITLPMVSAERFIRQMS